MCPLASLRRSTGAARCVACGKCTTMCPLGTNGDFSARRIAGQDLENELRGRGVGVWRCLTCASCEERCPEGVQFTDFVRGLRALVPEAVRRPSPHDGVFQSVARSMARNGRHASRPGWLTDELEVAEEGELALFVGCAPFFDIYFEDIDVHTLDGTRAAIRILNKLGIQPVLIDDEVCCGHDLLWRGDREEFEQLARANTKSFHERGIRHVLTTCAECTRTWKLDYPEVTPEYTPRVEHLAEFIAARTATGELEPVDSGTKAQTGNRRPAGAGTGTGTGITSDSGTGTGTEVFTYQDPCRLGRHLGVVDAPRRFFEALPGTPFVEMPRSGRDAMCCGTSGFIHCDAASRQLQQQRLREAAATRAGTLVTACPKCLIHFKCSQAEERRRDGTEPFIEIEDFAVFAERRVLANREVQEPVSVSSERETAGEAR